MYIALKLLPPSSQIIEKKKQAEMSGSRGTAHLVMRFEKGSKECSCSIEQVKGACCPPFFLLFLFGEHCHLVKPSGLQESRSHRYHALFSPITFESSLPPRRDDDEVHCGGRGGAAVGAHRGL
jgi:hypothetical protein